jgi:hypothetical protein
MLSVFLLVSLFASAANANDVAITCCAGSNGNPWGDFEGQWSIGMLVGKDPFHLSPPIETVDGDGSQVCSRNPIIRCADITDHPISFVADPFLFFPNGTDGPWYAFFEAKNWESNLNRRRGQIGTAVSYDKGANWKYLQIVLAEGFHLSYPFVFEYEGTIYMSPQGKSFSLYKCVSFPTKWEHFQVMHPRRNLNDNSLVHYDNRWWLFALHEQEAVFKTLWLHILYADSPLGPWHDHPQNCWYETIAGNETIRCAGKDVTTPLKKGSLRRHSGIRNGGRPIVHDGNLYRMVQNSLKAYGDHMDMYRIANLTIDGPFVEHVVPEFNAYLRLPQHVETWNRYRYHHVDIHEIVEKDGTSSWVALTDGDSGNGGACVVNWGSSNQNKSAPPPPRCADLRAGQPRQSRA